MLWLLAWRGVPADNVKAFITKVAKMSEWPRWDMGEGEFPIPPVYSSCLDGQRDDLAMDVSAAIDAACRRDDVRRIVLILVDHGNVEVLGTPPALISTVSVVEWAKTCSDSGKLLLLVLDACHSTVFAQATWAAAMRRLGAARAQALDAHVGFITSATNFCYTTAGLVSADARLVNLFGVRRIYKHLVNGFMYRNSLFARRFHQLLAYGLPVDHRRTVRDFVALMNQANFLRSGYLPAYVGGDEFAKVAFELFFPGVPFNPADQAPGWPHVTVGRVIRSEEIGALFDDDSDLGHRLIRMQIVDGVPTPMKEASGKHLCPGDLPPNHSIVPRLALEMGSGDSGEEVPILGRVQLWMIYHGLCRAFASGNVQGPERGANIQEAEELKAFLEGTLNVLVPDSSWPLLGWVAAFGTAFASQDAFKAAVTEVRDAIAHDLETDPTSWDERASQDED
jgi:hypothetical protein